MDELEKSTCYESPEAVFISFLAQRGIVCRKDDTITVTVPLKAVQNVMEIVQKIEKEMEDSKGLRSFEQKKIERLQIYIVQVRNQYETLRCTCLDLQKGLENANELHAKNMLELSGQIRVLKDESTQPTNNLEPSRS
jgi:hypothetical protein